MFGFSVSILALTASSCSSDRLYSALGSGRSYPRTCAAMYIVDRSSHTEILPRYFGSHSTAQLCGGAGKAPASYSIGFGPQVNGTPYTLPPDLTSGMLVSFGVSCE